MKKDITSMEDIQLMVNRFYDKVRADDILGPVFNERIQDRWPEHLEKMYRFWQTVLLEEHTYFGSPFPPHARLPVDGAHFDRWMQLFTETVDDFFEGEKADEAKWRGGKMAEMFQIKLDYFRNQGFKNLL